MRRAVLSAVAGGRGRASARPRGLAAEAPEPEQELPGADVEDAVAPRGHEREDRRGRRHAHAVEPGEELHAPPLTPGREDRARHAADRRGGVAAAVADRARAL